MNEPKVKTLDSFKELGSLERKNLLIDFAKNLFAAEGRSLALKDLKKFKITKNDIWKLFGGIQKLCISSGIPTSCRKKNMTDEELRIYIRKLAQKTSRRHVRMPC